MKNIPQQYDEIYLQACISDSDRDDLAWHGVTWSSDLIHQDDVKYLLATPEREVAAELLKACKLAVKSMGLKWEFKIIRPKIEAVIALADTPEETAQ